MWRVLISRHISNVKICNPCRRRVCCKCSDIEGEFLLFHVVQFFVYYCGCGVWGLLWGLLVGCGWCGNEGMCRHWMHRGVSIVVRDFVLYIWGIRDDANEFECTPLKMIVTYYSLYWIIFIILRDFWRIIKCLTLN